MGSSVEETPQITANGRAERIKENEIPAVNEGAQQPSIEAGHELQAEPVTPALSRKERKKRNILEKHDQRPRQPRNTRARNRNRQEQHHHRRRQVEQHEDEHELPEGRDGGDEADQGVDDTAKDHRGHDAEREDVEEDLFSASESDEEHARMSRPWTKST